MKKPNVLFILTDDQRYDTIHALGNPEILTPNLDRLVQRGTAFTQAHIPGGTSGAICMPSRAMLLTGRTLFHLEGRGESIPEAHTTIGEMFRKNGYDCFGTGKWHNGPPAFTRCFAGGDNIFFGGMWDHWNVPTNRYDPTGEYDNEINFVVNFWQSNAASRIHCDRFNPGKHSSELLTDTALTYLDHREEAIPFFLYLAYLAPHDPRTMPESFRKLYDPEKISLPKNFRKEHPFDFGVSDIRDETLAASPRDEAEIRRHIAEYYGMITHLDSQIGRLLDRLEEQGILEDTIIVLAGDNGLAVGQHGLMGKQNHYEHSIRVPLVFAGPGIPHGKTIDRYVYLLDIFPTLCERLGFETPETVEGISFAKMFDDANFKTREHLYFAYNELLRSVKDERYKLIEYRNHAERFQLFDLQTDPYEQNDLYGKAEYQETAERLKAFRETYRQTWENTGHDYTVGFWGDGCKSRPHSRLCTEF